MAELPNPIPSIIVPNEVAVREHSALAPLREPLFRGLWMAAVISYTGTWMQNIGTGWCMTTLTSSPMMVGMVQVAMSLPVFLVALPAGALADMVDRRRLLLMTQWWMVLAATALGLLTLSGAVTPWMLLLFTFLMGLGAVMNNPAWQAITPEVVSRRNFASAVALNSAGFNVARAVGPALGGIVIALAGSGLAFLLNAASFFGVILFLHRWKSDPHPAPVPLANLLDSLRAGVAYVRHSDAVKAVLVRTGLFSIFASVLWALLPLVARPHGAIGFGALTASFGVGALAGAGLLPSCRKRLSINKLFVFATILFAATVFGLSYFTSQILLAATLLLGGMAWIAILASLNVSAQTMAPAWVRARALSMYLLVLQGGMAAGSAIWGAVGDWMGVERAFWLAGAGLLLGLMTMKRYRLEVRELESCSESFRSARA
jgi:MFS family permease